MRTVGALETWDSEAVEAGAAVGTVRGGEALAAGRGGGTFAVGAACFVEDAGLVTVDVAVTVVFGVVLIFVTLLRCVTGVVCRLVFCFIFTFVPLPLDEIPREGCCVLRLLSVTLGL